jgi:hypothetical protein
MQDDMCADDLQLHAPFFEECYAALITGLNDFLCVPSVLEGKACVVYEVGGVLSPKQKRFQVRWVGVECEACSFNFLILHCAVPFGFVLSLCTYFCLVFRR